MFLKMNRGHIFTLKLFITIQENTICLDKLKMYKNIVHLGYLLRKKIKILLSFLKKIKKK
jgi:hypothetical protein